MGCCQCQNQNQDQERLLEQKNEKEKKHKFIEKSAIDGNSTTVPNHQDSVKYQNNQTDEMINNELSDFKINPKMFVRSSSTALIDSYTIGKVLGQGGFGTVCLVTQKQTNIVRAMKMIQKKKLTKKAEDQMFEELQILREIDHANIVKVFEHFQDDKYHYLISEYCSGGELFERIKDVSPFSEREAAKFMKQIIGAISYCHLNSICHRDLKPENILFDSKDPKSSLKVIDFGASTKFDPNQKLTKRIGTPFYVAPEILNKEPYDQKCDIWSLGILTYILLSGYPPFWGQTDKDIYQKVKEGKFQFYPEDWNKISDDAKDLISKMLEYEPSKRITAEEAHAHPWIHQNVYMEPLDQKMMRRLMSFNAKNKIKVAIMQLMATQVVQTKDKEQLIKYFQSLDKNGDGYLSQEELIEGYTVMLSDPFKAKEIVNQVFRDLDSDQNGRVDFTEFMVASISKEKFLTKEKISQAFKLIDEDDNGQITKKELEDMMGGLPLNDKVWQGLLKSVDVNGDGMVTYIYQQPHQQISKEEFLELLVQSVDKDIFDF